MKAILLVQDTYQPGDQPPEGYIAWHEWAEVQRRAGIKQQMCGRCSRWKTPQELSDIVDTTPARTSRGVRRALTDPVCNACAVRATESR